MNQTKTEGGLLMNSKVLTILTLIIAIVALIVGIAAFNKAGGQADIRQAIESFKSEIKTTVTDLREVRGEVGAKGAENIAEIKTKLELVEAKAHLLAAKMYIALDNNYDKAASELEKAADNFENARAGASQVTKEKIKGLKSGVTEAKQYVGDKSAQAIDKLTELLKKTEEAVDSLGEETSK
jgi:ribosome-associated translation inhibitor RaiA